MPNFVCGVPYHHRVAARGVAIVQECELEKNLSQIAYSTKQRATSVQLSRVYWSMKSDTNPHRDIAGAVL